MSMSVLRLQPFDATAMAKAVRVSQEPARPSKATRITWPLSKSWRISSAIEAVVINAMTVDVEDFYHVSAFADVIKPAAWGGFESRVVNNTNRLLELFSR